MQDQKQYKLPQKNYITVLGLSIVFFALVFVIHALYPSMINNFHLTNVAQVVDNTFISDAYRYHLQHPAFARRPVISGLLYALTSIGFSFVWSYVIIQGLFFIGSCVLLYLIARQIQLTHKQALLSVTSFFLSFSILFAFLAPVYTYDDWAQYFFLFLSLLFLLRFRLAWSALAFFLACLARETSVFFLPAFALIYTYKLQAKKGLLKNYLPFLFIYGGAVVAYGICTYFLLSSFGLLDDGSTYIVQERFAHWEYNTQSRIHIWETVASFVLAIGVQMMFLWWYIKQKKHRFTQLQHRMLIGGLICFLVNTPIVLVATRAQEFRLGALPLVFLWPLLGLCIEQFCVLLKVAVTQKKLFQFTAIRWLARTIVAASLFAFAGYFTYHMYVPVDVWSPVGLFRKAIFLTLCMMIFIWWFSDTRFYEKNS